MFKQTTSTPKFDDLVDALFGGIEQGMSSYSVHDTIREFDGGFVVDIELPGVKKSDTTISLDGSTITVTATKKKPVDGSITTDSRKYGTFTKKYKLNASVSNTDIAAKMEDGILSITIPKSEAAKSRTVTIN